MSIYDQILDCVSLEDVVVEEEFKLELPIKKKKKVGDKNLKKRVFMYKRELNYQQKCAKGEKLKNKTLYFLTHVGERIDGSWDSYSSSSHSRNKYLVASDFGFMVVEWTSRCKYFASYERWKIEAAEKSTDTFRKDVIEVTCFGDDFVGTQPPVFLLKFLEGEGYKQTYFVEIDAMAKTYKQDAVSGQREDLNRMGYRLVK